MSFSEALPSGSLGPLTTRSTEVSMTLTVAATGAAYGTTEVQIAETSGK
jgi:hypothetical protein